MILILLLLFLFGTLFGSFASVITTRLHENYSRRTIRSVLVGRSQCPQCKTMIQRYDLVPLISRIVLRAKCRACNSKISPLYPIIEILSGFAFVVGGLIALGSQTISIDGVMQTRAPLLFWVFLMRSVFLLSLTDYRTQELDRTGTVLFYLLICIGIYTDILGPSVTTALYWAMGYFLIFATLYGLAMLYVALKYKQKRTPGMGLGDVLIAPGIGILLVQPGVGVLENIERFSIFLMLAAIVSLLLAGITRLQGNNEPTVAFLPGLLMSMVVLQFI